MPINPNNLPTSSDKTMSGNAPHAQLPARVTVTNQSLQVGATFSLQAQVTQLDGSTPGTAICNASVVFSVDGKPLYQVQTDDHGMATSPQLRVDDSWSLGVHAITAEYLGNGYPAAPRTKGTGSLGVERAKAGISCSFILKLPDDSMGVVAALVAPTLEVCFVISRDSDNAYLQGRTTVVTLDGKPVGKFNSYPAQFNLVVSPQKLSGKLKMSFAGDAHYAPCEIEHDLATDRVRPYAYPSLTIPDAKPGKSVKRGDSFKAIIEVSRVPNILLPVPHVKVVLYCSPRGQPQSAGTKIHLTTNDVGIATAPVHVEALGTTEVSASVEDPSWQDDYRNERGRMSINADPAPIKLTVNGPATAPANSTVHFDVSAIDVETGKTTGRIEVKLIGSSNIPENYSDDNGKYTFESYVDGQLGPRTFTVEFGDNYRYRHTRAQYTVNVVPSK